MLVQPRVHSGASCRQGSRPVSIAGLRSQLAKPSQMSDGHRQRLLDLARRLARVQTCVGEHSRVQFSEHARVAMGFQADA